MQSPPGASAVIDGRRYLYFVGTGYLGLQGHPEVIRAACEAAQQYGVGSATTRAGFGNSPPVLAVERLAAELLASETAFYFPSGYAGNHILAKSLAESCDAVFVDELSHYCLIEAAQLTARPVFRFAHRDPQSLDASLRANLKPAGRPLLMSDGVFSALGEIAPVVEYKSVLGKYPGAVMLLDDAHALGVLGEHGRGTFEHVGWGLSQFRAPSEAWSDENGTVPFASPGGTGLFFCSTLSKAIGGYGGIIPGPQRWIERLKATSHWYDGASPPPAPVAAASARALELVLSDPGMRVRLHDNVRLLKSGLGRLGLAVDATPVPIVCLRLGTADNMRRIQSGLKDRGVLVAYMAAYSGLGSEGALRLAVFATHTAEMIEELIDKLKGLL
jgi:7-keto-8-aminopelargonate synthetase-like enzyme